MKIKPQRILIINVNWLGDVLFSTPFIKAVRRAYPDSYIACMVVGRCVDVLEGNPNIDEIIIYDEDGIHKGLLGKMKFIKNLRWKRFDTAFLLHRSFTRALVAFLAGIKNRIGYYTRKRALLLTHAVEPPEEDLHKVEYFLAIARDIGIAAADRDYEFFVSEGDRKYIKQLLERYGVRDSDKIVVIHPGGNWEPKRWPKENFVQLIKGLKDVKVVISGGSGEIRLAEEINKESGNEAIVTCGRTDLRQLAALLERAGLVISGDSGPMHIAVAVGSKVLALFGPTSPAITGPYGRGRYKIIQKDIGCEVPCYDSSCTDNRCMKAITTKEVLEEAQKILNAQEDEDRP